MGINFKPKNIIKQTTPAWPNFLKWVTQNVLNLNMRECLLTAKDMELFAYAIG